MTTELLKNLYRQLCDFGLNSHEWIIKQVANGEYIIHHHNDQDFRFMGKIEKQKWSQIWLVSI